MCNEFAVFIFIIVKTLFDADTECNTEKKVIQ